MERMVSTLNLKIGMYISGLDRPWLDTPFLTQGYFIKDIYDIDELMNYCKYVFIDIDKGEEADTYLDEIPGSAEESLNEYLQHGEKLVEYKDGKSVLEEFPEAEATLTQAADKIGSVMENVQEGGYLDVQGASEVVQPLLNSMIRNVDALLWMLKIQGSEDRYRQALDKCTLGLAFGRHLGFHMVDIRTMAMGMLLLDVGKYKIDKRILDKPGPLTKEEFNEVRRHVEYGVELLQKTGGVSNTIINMVRTHHERLNGKGYPNGLEGNHIPLMGRVAAILDSYASMARKTTYSDAMPPHKILQELYKWRGTYFDTELLEEFLKCVGVYPTGSLVEMTTGEVGIVVAQNGRERLKPTICMLLDKDKKTWERKNPIIDLSKNPIDADGNRRKILHALKSGAYGIKSWQPSDEQRALFARDD